MIDPPLVLAPMAGVTHSPLRRLVASFARPGLFFSEMLSARRLPHDARTGSVWLQRGEEERPMAYQIFAASPEEAETGCRILMEAEAEIVDLNLACPAPNISGRRKAGAHLLDNLQGAEAILRAMRSVLDRPLTAKIRLGHSPDLVFLKDFTAMLEDCGVAAITLHPRLVTEKLKRLARWDYIGHLKTMARVPVIGNGDVRTPEDCRRMFAQTGCDGVMIGRAAIQKPWIFAEILGQPTVVDRDFLLATWLSAAGSIAESFPETKALGRIKEFTWYFGQNLKFGHGFAARMQPLESLAACLEYGRERFPKEAL